MSLVETCHMCRWLVVPPPPLESHRNPVVGLLALSSVNFLATMSFNSVIPLRDSTRADWISESAKLEVTLTPHDLGVGVC